MMMMTMIALNAIHFQRGRGIILIQHALPGIATSRTRPKTIGHFRAVSSLCFKERLSTKPLT